MSTGIRILLYVMSLLVPLAGFIVGAIYYSKPDAEYKHVGKICIVLGIISILLTIGLSALLYVMVLGFGSGTTEEAPQVLFSKTAITGGELINVLAVTNNNADWSEVAIHLSEGTEVVSWHPVLSNLDNGSISTASCGVRQLGSLSVSLEVTDIAGNGYVGGGDYFVITSDPVFHSGTTYEFFLVYEPTGASMGAAVYFTS